MARLKFLFIITCAFILGIVHSSVAMVYDNRFFPLLWKPYVTVEGRPSRVRFEFFAITGKRAFDKNKNEILLPAIYGNYDQGELAKAFVDLGCSNPLKSEWQGAKIPWKISGKLQGQGFTFSYHQALTDWLTFGISSFVMKMHSWHEFFLELDEVSLRLQQGDILELDETRRSMHRQMGLCGDHAHHTGIGDIDFYLRFGYSWDYTLKFRHIDTGARFGIILPAATKRDEHYPASIPFGGERHWGIYGVLDSEFELKEDWRAGLFFWLGKRFAKTQERRLPVRNEPQPYGAVLGQACINPGLTFAFSPYLSFENLRDGFGLRGQYSLIVHDHDEWKAVSPSCTTVDLEAVNKLSAWGSDYFSVSAFYDFGKMRVKRSWYPIVTLSWDIPASVFVADKSAKTQKVTLGIEWSF